MRLDISTAKWAAALGLAALIATVPPSVAEISQPAELYFEAKLLFRDRVMMQRVAIDQWAGGKLLMQRRPLGPGTILELVRPLEHPWTFRWYPAKHEVKLGAAVAVPEPTGHPYGSLAEALTVDARRRYDMWWNDDTVPPTAARQPQWLANAEKFWATRHSQEEDAKDPLHDHPVFPFHVLGDPAGRLGFAVGRDGGVISDSVAERMSEPWLSDGWRAWQRGDRRSGYGYWESERPGWEPHTYQAFAAALSLLAWSPFKAGDPAKAGGLEPGATYDVMGAGLPMVARVFETLNPRFENRIDWKGYPTLRFKVDRTASGALAVEGDSGDTVVKNERKVRYRVWRYAEYDEAAQRLTQDEVQVFAAHQNTRIKIWIKIGYRPAGKP